MTRAGSPGLLLGVASLCALFWLARAVAASRRDLFGDEAFYWMCSRRLALAYVDHPFMTALWVRAGSSLLGARPAGARLLFLLLGALLPWLLYLLARPLVGRRDALLAAGATQLVPVLAVGAFLAVPDVPLALFSALSLLGFERATRTGSAWAWCLAGAAAGLALATHYRALLIPASYLLYLLATPRGRAQWGRRGLWIGAAAMLPGLLPVLLFNLEHGFAPLRFQFVDRHAPSPSLRGVLAHLRLQLAAVSPLLYVALAGVLVGASRRGARGDDRAALLALFALVHLGAFLVASPFSDARHVSLHWTAPGYLPLLVLLPGALRDFAAGRGEFARGLAWVVPASALLITAALMLEVATGVFGSRELSRAFGGWSEAAAAVRAELPDIPALPDGPTLLVADDYLLAGNLEMRLGSRVRVYVLDHAKHAEHGRALQFRLWGIDEAGLRERAGASALVVLDRDQSRSSAWGAWRRHVASLFDALLPLAEARAEGRRPGAPRFYLFRGVGVRATPRPDAQP